MHSSNDKVELGLDMTDVKMVEDASQADSSPKQMTPAEKALVRKLDWMILPMLWFMYFLNFLDRAAITVARLDNMNADLHLSSTQYQTCVSGLFIGYILGQIPSSRRAPF